MPTDRVDYPIVPTGKIRTPNASLHNGRINKVVNRMNITSNPLSADGEKVWFAAAEASVLFVACNTFPPPILYSRITSNCCDFACSRKILIPSPDPLTKRSHSTILRITFCLEISINVLES